MHSTKYRVGIAVLVSPLIALGWIGSGCGGRLDLGNGIVVDEAGDDSDAGRRSGHEDGGGDSPFGNEDSEANAASYVGHTPAPEGGCDDAWQTADCIFGTDYNERGTNLCDIGQYPDATSC